MHAYAMQYIDQIIIISIIYIYFINREDDEA